jgi:hypothetical protein
MDLNAPKISGFKNAARDTALAFESVMEYGAPRGSAVQIEQERARYAGLNGSGPIDRDGAVNQARRSSGILSAISGGNGPIPPLGVGALLAVGIVALIFIFRKLR